MSQVCPNCGYVIQDTEATDEPLEEPPTIEVTEPPELPKPPTSAGQIPDGAPVPEPIRPVDPGTIPDGASPPDMTPTEPPKDWKPEEEVNPTEEETTSTEEKPPFDQDATDSGISGIEPNV